MLEKWQQTHEENQARQRERLAMKKRERSEAWWTEFNRRIGDNAIKNTVEICYTERCDK